MVVARDADDDENSGARPRGDAGDVFGDRRLGGMNQVCVGGNDGG